jgi:hypothetical protein
VDAENAEDAEVVGAVDAEDAEEFRGNFRFSDPTFFDLVIVFRFGNRFGKFEYIFHFGDRFWQRTLIVFIPVWMSHFFN